MVDLLVMLQVLRKLVHLLGMVQGELVRISRSLGEAGPGPTGVALGPDGCGILRWARSAVQQRGWLLLQLKVRMMRLMLLLLRRRRWRHQRRRNGHPGTHCVRPRELLRMQLMKRRLQLLLLV